MKADWPKVTRPSFLCVTESKMIEHEKRKIFAVDPLRHSRRPCGGLWADIKKLIKRYPSDLRDMFRFQVTIATDYSVPHEERIKHNF